MHELPIVQQLFSKVISKATKHQAKKVTQVTIALGIYSGFIDDSIEFYWPIVAKDSIAEQAKIVIKRIPGKLQCTKCGKQMKLNEQVELCPVCQSFKLTIVAGGECQLVSIEYE